MSLSSASGSSASGSSASGSSASGSSASLAWTGWRGLRDLLRTRDFRRLWSTRLASQACDGAFQVGLASVFFFSPERQADAAAVAGAFTVLLLPYSVVGPWAGVLLDRWRRRSVLVWANLLRSVMVLGVAALVVTSGPGPVLYGAVLACLSVNRFYLAGLSAALPHVVERPALVLANSVSPTSGTLAAILGGLAGLGIRTLLGTGAGADAGVLVVTAVGYAGSSALAARMHPDLLGPDRDAGADVVRSAGDALRGVAGGLAAGARHVRPTPAAPALAAVAAYRFCYGVSTIAVTLLYRNHFSDPADVDAGLRGLAGVFAASGVGFLAAALVTPVVTRALSPARWIVVCFLASAAVEAVFLLRLTVALTLAGALVIGAAAQSVKICVDTIVQTSVGDAYRGRVFSFYDVLFNLSFVAAAAFAAATLPASGVSRAVYAVVAAGYLLAGVAYGVRSRSSTPASAATPTAGAQVA